MNFVTEKELTVALDNLNEWMTENPNLKLIHLSLRKCNEKEVTLVVEYVDPRKGYEHES